MAKDGNKIKASSDSTESGGKPRPDTTAHTPNTIFVKNTGNKGSVETPEGKIRTRKNG